MPTPPSAARSIGISTSARLLRSSLVTTKKRRLARVELARRVAPALPDTYFPRGMSLRVGRNAIKRILLEAGMAPAPERGKAAARF
jgi:hypothetical protein